MRRSGLILSRKFVIGILLWTTLSTTEALRGSAVVLQAKTKVAEQKEQTDDENNGPAAANVTKPQLTGIPQIDYVLDPNLPRELNGHNLTDYPFYNAVPDDIDFKCDGLHDGFYASVPHKCQVYHHCLFGTRYDFLCANYTAFDQKTFICHFVSEVDCDNSPKYYKRNEALYKEATTTSTTTTTTTPSTTTSANPPAQQSNGNGGRHNVPRRRRPYRRRRPMYEYYYDDEEYADTDYYEDEVSSLNHRRTPYRKHNKDSYQSENRDTDADYDAQTDHSKPTAVRPSTSGSSNAASVYERPRAPPKIRRPVPKSERDKYDYTSKQQASNVISSTTTTTTTTTEKPSSTAPGKGKPQAEDEYYEDEEEYEYEEPKPAPKSKHHLDYDFPTGFEDTRRYINRYRGRMPARKRAEMYDDYDVKERPSRINRRKEYTRYEADRPRNARPAHRMKASRHEDEYKYAPAMPSHKKRPSMEMEYRPSGTGRRAEAKRPATEDDYYYDEEEPEELPPKRRRPQKVYEKGVKSTTKAQSKDRYQDDPEPQPQPPANTKYSKDIVGVPRNSKANTLENEVPKVSPSYNEISTTESLSSRYTPNQNQKYTNTVKAVKIVTNSLKEELEDAADTYPRSQPDPKIPQTKPIAETAPSAAPKYNVVSLKTLPPQTEHRPDAYSETPRKEKKPFQYEDNGSRYANRTIIPVRHFVVSPLRNFVLPVNNESAKPSVRPVKEDHLVPETLNAINNGNYFNTAFISEPKPFAEASSKSPSQQPNYRQEHRLYNSDRLYTTNSITFPAHPPANYDITAPGPSAPAEEPTAPEKKYSEAPTYTASADYDVTYNDALQPSTLLPVRRYPSTSFYIQHSPQQQPQQQPQQRSVVAARLPSDYAFNKSAYSSLPRSQIRYK